MLRFRNSRVARSALLPLTLIMSLSACQKTIIHTSPFEDFEREAPGTVTVVLTDGTRTVLRGRPKLVADSIIGAIYDPRTRAYTDTTGFALTDVLRIEQKKTPTEGVIIGSILIAGSVGLFVYCYRENSPCN